MPVNGTLNDKIRQTPLPLGIDIFANIGNCYYTDKTLLVKDIIDSGIQTILFTRPRRFGKTLAMTMLQSYFEIPTDKGQLSEEDTSKYFRHLKIWQQGEKYTSEQGKYPVIMLSFKGIKGSSFESSLKDLRHLISSEYGRHEYLLSSSKLNNADKSFFSGIYSKKADDSDYHSALLELSKFLYKHHGQKAIVLIDEYDKPIQTAWESHDDDFYDKMIVFMRALMVNVLKTNPYLHKGILTGITRVSKESIFSGLNNIIVDTILDNRYSEYFGFTQQETDEMLSFYGMDDKKAEVAEWYNGYVFGNTEIYNPWSLLKYVESEGLALPYWVNTSDNKLVGDVLENIGNEDAEILKDFISGGTITQSIDTNIIYPELEYNGEAAYSLLLQSGYLKCVGKTISEGNILCTLKIPNREVQRIYLKEIVNRFLRTDMPRAVNAANSFSTAMLTRNAAEMQKTLQKLLLSTCSYFDLTEEKDYQNFMLGLLAASIYGYDIKGNREAGHGRTDIMMRPKTNTKNARNLPGIIIEIKHCEATEQEKSDPKLMDKILEKAATEALDQIDQMSYASELQSAGCDKIMKYGAAFSGKRAKVLFRT
ncbi:MAG: ATP-binding protein [Elusimicrobiales bacterium]|nr:ATP-binding protein [Elusimicrobiales bacterium]